MKKCGKRVLAALLAVLFLLMLSGCGGRYKITVTGGEDLIASCPKHAKAGETVTVETVVVCDGDLYLSVSGIEGDAERVQDGIYTFTMPENDVQVKAWVISNGLA